MKTKPFLFSLLACALFAQVTSNVCAPTSGDLSTIGSCTRHQGRPMVEVQGVSQPVESSQNYAWTVPGLGKLVLWIFAAA